MKRKRKRKWNFWPDQIDTMSHVILFIHNLRNMSTNGGGAFQIVASTRRSTDPPSCVSRGRHVIHDIGHFMHISGRDALLQSKDIIRSPYRLPITGSRSPKLVLQRSSEPNLRDHKSKTKAKVKNMARPNLAIVP